MLVESKSWLIYKYSITVDYPMILKQFTLESPWTEPLTYKTHIKKVAKNVQPRHNLVQKLAGST
jgi:hypothetical protein